MLGPSSKKYFSEKQLLKKSISDIAINYSKNILNKRNSRYSL